MHLTLFAEDRLLNEHGGEYSGLDEDGIDSNEYYRIITERVINILKKNSNYMQEEPVSEDLEEAAWQYYDRNKPLMPSKFDLHKELIDFFKAGVMWKEQNDSNLSEVLHRDSLDEMAEEYSSCTYLEEVLREGDREVLKARLKNTFKAGAKWQEKKDQSTIELAEDHAMFAGMEKMREQMMKDAVVMEAHEEYGELWGDIRKFNTEKGKKYKVIIIKQEDD